MKSMRPSFPLNFPGPSSRTLHPLTELAPPEIYLFSNGSTLLLPYGHAIPQSVCSTRVFRASKRMRRIVEIELRILSIGYIEKDVAPLRVLVELEYAVHYAQQVSGRLYMGTHGMVAIRVGDAQPHPHDEQVLVVVAQDGVACRYIVEIVVLECRADPRHVDIAQVQDVERIVRMPGRIRPMILPRSREDAAVELRPVLQVPADGRLRDGTAPAAEGMGDERIHEPRKLQTRPDAVLLEVVVLVSLKPRNGLESRPKLHAEQLAATEEVAVLIRQHRGRTEVACRIGALGLKGEGVGLVVRELYLGVQVAVGRAAVAYGLADDDAVDGLQLPEVDVRIAHRPQTGKVVVGLLQVGGREPRALPQGDIVADDAAAEVKPRGITGTYPDTVDDVARMGHRGVAGTGAVLRQMERNADMARAAHRVGRIVDEVLVEAVESRIGKYPRYPPPLLLECRNRELQRAQGRAVAEVQMPLQDAGHDGVPDVVPEAVYNKRCAGMETVDHPDLPAPRLGVEVHPRLHVAHVLHGKAQVLARLPGLKRIVEHRFLAYLLQRAVNPLRAVPACQRIGAERNLEEREPPRVAFLADILREQRGVQTLVVGTHVDPVEQVAVFGNELIGRAGRQYRRQDGNGEYMADVE